MTAVWLESASREARPQLWTNIQGATASRSGKRILDPNADCNRLTVFRSGPERTLLYGLDCFVIQPVDRISGTSHLHGNDVILTVCNRAAAPILVVCNPWQSYTVVCSRLSGYPFADKRPHGPTKGRMERDRPRRGARGVLASQKKRQTLDGSLLANSSSPPSPDIALFVSPRRRLLAHDEPLAAQQVAVFQNLRLDAALHRGSAVRRRTCGGPPEMPTMVHHGEQNLRDAAISGVCSNHRSAGGLKCLGMCFPSSFSGFCSGPRVARRPHRRRPRSTPSVDALPRPGQQPGLMARPSLSSMVRIGKQLRPPMPREITLSVSFRRRPTPSWFGRPSSMNKRSSSI